MSFHRTVCLMCRASSFVEFQMGPASAAIRKRYARSEFMSLYAGGDPQVDKIKELINAKPKTMVRIVTQYRGARKSYTAQKACSRFYLFRKPVYVTSLDELEKCTANDKLFEEYLAKQEDKVTQILKFVASVATIIVLVYFLGFQTGWLDDYIKETRQKIPHTIATLLYFVIIFVYAFFRKFRISVTVVDDIIGTAKTKEEIQVVLRRLHERATAGYYVIIVSSNEGLNYCFKDTNPTTKEFVSFPPPEEPILHAALWQFFYDQAFTYKYTSFKCPTEDIIRAAREVLPEHIAMSMRLWMWAGNEEPRMKLIETLCTIAATQPSQQEQLSPKLSVAQVALLADLVVHLDLQSELPFREQALIRSPLYNNKDKQYTIKVPKPTPRRLVLASAVIQYYAVVEELMLLQLFIDALKTGDAEVQEVLQNLPLTKPEPTVDHVLGLVSKIKARLTGVAQDKMNCMEVCWRRYKPKTCQELQDSIISSHRSVTWAVLPQPTVDKECPTTLDALYNQLPVSTVPVIQELRVASVPLYFPIMYMLGNANNDNNNKNRNNDDKNNNKENHNYSSEQSNV